MRLSPQQTSKLYRFAGRTLARYMRWVHRSSTVVLDPPDARERIGATHPFILSMWHGQFMMMPVLHIGGYRVAAIAARHGDAEILAEMLPQFNIECVRGAGAAGRMKERGGSYALRTAVKLLKGGATFSMTADVPPGPARHAGSGIVTIARLSGRPMLPLAVASSRFIALNSWSRMTINLPYSKIAYVIGEPIWVPDDADEETIEHYRLEIEAALNTVTERAYRIAGGNIKRATPRVVLEAAAGGVAPLGWLLKAYRAGTSLMRPAAPLLLKLRERQGKENPKRFNERFGEGSVPRPDGQLMWLHAASVGETNAILPLIERLSAGRDLAVVLTTGTTTSAGLAAQRLGAKAIHQYVPLDAPEYVRAFLDHWRPDLAVFTESEIWPNLIIETAERRIPLALVNGRMSGRSFDRWRRNSRFSRPLFSRFDIVLAQNEKLVRMFSDLGARKAIAVGNLKIDAPPPPVDVGELERLRGALKGRPILVAASTHEGEEDIVAAAHRQIARTIPGICTIIAPRHPERGTAIAEHLKSLGYGVAQRSAGQLPGERTDIYIADTIGELGTLYALTAVAFIGGSLVKHGGQNPIEAIGHGAAVLTGPHSSNFRDFYRALFRHKGAQQVKDAEELAAAAATLIGSEAELQRMRVAAKTALQSLSGALDRTAEALAAYLAKPGTGVRRAS
jgi:3-deoxy-D-manno-octulosonic-acid transferase